MRYINLRLLTYLLTYLLPIRSYCTQLGLYQIWHNNASWEDFGVDHDKKCLLPITYETVHKHD